MSGIRIKICWLMRPEDIGAVNEARPDFAGFILAEGRRRTLQPEQMRELTRLLAPGILRTAVFLDQDREWIARLAASDLMDVIQLHGNESEADIRFLQESTGKQVIKAFRIDCADDARRAEASPADLVLLDHGAGGSGEAFDWSLIRGIRRDFILAGGLTPENVREAASLTRPAAVDVSSGVETQHRKDPLKIRQFVREVRGMT